MTKEESLSEEHGNVAGGPRQAGPVRSSAAPTGSSTTVAVNRPAESRASLQRAPGASDGRLWVDLAVLAAIVVLAGVLPQMTDQAGLYQGERIAIFALFCLSVNLLVGYSGIISFGQAAFYGVGAYAVAQASLSGVPFGLDIVLALVLAGGLAVLVGVFTSRAVGLGVLILTLAVAQGIYSVLSRSTHLGGSNGLVVDSNNPWSVISADYWYFVMTICILGAVMIRAVTRSPFGIILRAARDDAIRVEHMGINVRAYRLGMFVIAGTFGGLAGALDAHTKQAVTPDLFSWTNSGEALIAILIGGLYSFWGAVLGAAIYVLLIDRLSELASTTSDLYLGLLVVALVLLLPQGVLSIGGRVRELQSRLKSSDEKWWPRRQRLKDTWARWSR